MSLKWHADTIRENKMAKNKRFRLSRQSEPSEPSEYSIFEELSKDEPVDIVPSMEYISDRYVRARRVRTDDSTYDKLLQMLYSAQVIRKNEDPMRIFDGEYKFRSEEPVSTISLDEPTRIGNRFINVQCSDLMVFNWHLNSNGRPVNIIGDEVYNRSAYLIKRAFLFDIDVYVHIDDLKELLEKDNYLKKRINLAVYSYSMKKKCYTYHLISLLKSPLIVKDNKSKKSRDKLAVYESYYNDLRDRLAKILPEGSIDPSYNNVAAKNPLSTNNHTFILSDKTYSLKGVRSDTIMKKRNPKKAKYIKNTEKRRKAAETPKKITGYERVASWEHLFETKGVNKAVTYMKDGHECFEFLGKTYTREHSQDNYLLIDRFLSSLQWKLFWGDNPDVLKQKIKKIIAVYEIPIDTYSKTFDQCFNFLMTNTGGNGKKGNNALNCMKGLEQKKPKNVRLFSYDELKEGTYIEPLKPNNRGKHIKKGMQTPASKIACEKKKEAKEKRKEEMIRIYKECKGDREAVIAQMMSKFHMARATIIRHYIPFLNKFIKEKVGRPIKKVVNAAGEFLRKKRKQLKALKIPYYSCLSRTELPKKYWLKPHLIEPGMHLPDQGKDGYDKYGYPIAKLGCIEWIKYKLLEYEMVYNEDYRIVDHFYTFQ